MSDKRLVSLLFWFLFILVGTLALVSAVAFILATRG
jgi:hypothetical protein